MRKRKKKKTKKKKENKREKKSSIENKEEELLLLERCWPIRSVVGESGAMAKPYLLYSLPGEFCMPFFLFSAACINRSGDMLPFPSCN